MNKDNYTPDNKPIVDHTNNTLEVNEKIVEVLNSLVQINNDRIEGYGKAADDTEDAGLRILFNDMKSKSNILKTELIGEVNKYGGQATESTTTLGKAFRVWMDLKAAVTGKNHKAILNSCEFGEEAAQETYAEAIKQSEHLPAYLVQMITYQKSQLREDLNHVKFLAEKE